MNIFRLQTSSSYIFNWLSHQPSFAALFGWGKNINTLPQLTEEVQQQDLQKEKLDELLQGAFHFTNRNARAPKKSNHGARPCSSVMRRLKKKYFYRRTKEEMTPEMEPKKKFEL